MRLNEAPSRALDRRVEDRVARKSPDVAADRPFGAEFFSGREAIESFLTRKWQRELDYRLIKEVWAFSGHRIAVRFVYEWHGDSGNWNRSHGNEQWEFDNDGLMQRREASINDVRIAEAERKFHW